MRRLSLLSTVALAAAAILATPAVAQRAGDPALQEMQREQARPMRPAVPQQNRLAAEADAMGRQDAARWVAEAEEAVRRGRLGAANELLERAETRLLTRSTLAASADQPMRSPVVDQLSSARQALARRDREGAMQQIASARQGIRSMPMDDMATGSDPRGAMPMQGGGYGSPGGYPQSTYPAQGGGAGGAGMPSPHGGTMMRDQGVGGRTMSRADALILAQAGGGGGGGGMPGTDQSGGLQGSTPGSPGTGNLGSTPQSTLGLGQQPAQGSAVPLAPNQGGGRAAPIPGANVPAPGGTGRMPGDQPLRGAPPPGTR